MNKFAKNIKKTKIILNKAGFKRNKKKFQLTKNLQSQKKKIITTLCFKKCPFL